MRKVILSTNITLDGFMAGPGGELDWHIQNWNDEMAEYAFEQLSAMDTILVGRKTYEGMADFWPTAYTSPGSRRGDIEFAGMMNNYPKIVFSRTLDTVKWNNSRVVKENIPEEIATLKEQGGKNMIIWGGAGIVSSFMQMDLIDEYRLWCTPVILGTGMPLSGGIQKRTDLRLLNTRTFSNGVILLSYQPMRPWIRRCAY